jgi:hypothetical protein
MRGTLAMIGQSNAPDLSAGRAPTGAIHVASEPLSRDVEYPKGFYLRIVDGQAWLRGYRCDDTYVCGRRTIGSHSYRQVANETGAHYLTTGRNGGNGTHHVPVEDPLAGRQPTSEARPPGYSVAAQNHVGKLSLLSPTVARPRPWNKRLL